jgi:hypothetical protein
MGKTKFSIKEKSKNKFLLELFKEKKYCDMSIEINNGEKINLHKFVISNGSDYFLAVLKDNNEIKIDEKNEKLFKSYLNFLYLYTLNSDELKEEEYFEFLLMSLKVKILK